MYIPGLLRCFELLAKVGLRTPRNCLPDSEAVNGEEVGNFYRPDYWGSASGYLDCAGRDQTSQKKHALSLFDLPASCLQCSLAAIDPPVLVLQLLLPITDSAQPPLRRNTFSSQHLNSLSSILAAAASPALTHAFSCESSAPTARPTASLSLFRPRPRPRRIPRQ